MNGMLFLSRKLMPFRLQEEVVYIFLVSVWHLCKSLLILAFSYIEMMRIYEIFL